MCFWVCFCVCALRCNGLMFCLRFSKTFPQKTALNKTAIFKRRARPRLRRLSRVFSSAKKTISRKEYTRRSRRRGRCDFLMIFLFFVGVRLWRTWRRGSPRARWRGTLCGKRSENRGRRRNLSSSCREKRRELFSGVVHVFVVVAEEVVFGWWWWFCCLFSRS